MTTKGQILPVNLDIDLTRFWKVGISTLWAMYSPVCCCPHQPPLPTMCPYWNALLYSQAPKSWVWNLIRKYFIIEIRSSSVSARILIYMCQKTLRKQNSIPNSATSPTQVSSPLNCEIQSQSSLLALWLEWPGLVKLQQRSRTVIAKVLRVTVSWPTILGPISPGSQYSMTLDESLPPPGLTHHWQRWGWNWSVILSKGDTASQFSSVQLLSRVWLFATPQTAAHQASLSITNSWSLFKLMSIESVMPSNHFIFCRPLLLLPSIFPSIRVFSDKSILHIRWPEYWSFSFSISHSNEYSGLISFRMDCLDLLAVQGTLKSLLQHHSSKASILWHSAFFMVQLSHPYMTTGKTIALTRWTLLAK